MSLKFHIIHYIVKDIEKQLEKDKQKVKRGKKAKLTVLSRTPRPRPPSWTAGSSGSWWAGRRTATRFTRRTSSDRCPTTALPLHLVLPCL